MSTLDALRYHLNVSLLGHGYLRFDRLRLAARMRQRGFWKHEHLSPPLLCSPWLKELISRHYLKGRYANLDGKVAWATSGAPVAMASASWAYSSAVVV